MKTTTKVLFFVKTGDAMSVLDAVGCGLGVARLEENPDERQHIIITLDDTDERLQRLLDWLTREDKQATVIRRDIFTEEELANARLLYLYNRQTIEIDGDVGWKTTFDLTGTCPGCYAGARQTAPYLLPAEELPRLEGHRMVTSYWDHILVDDRLADALVATGATGLAFHQVYAFTKEKRQMKLRWKQLAAPNVLPRVSSRTTGLYRNRECKLCERDGYCGSQSTPMRIAYRREDLHGALDVNSTWEGFNFGIVDADGKPRKISVPGILVTPKVWRVFRDAGVTEVDFLPIRVVED